MTAPARLTVVEPASAKPKTRAQMARTLARAMRRRDKAEAALEAARAEEAKAFAQWAAGRRISRDEARIHLTSAGLLEERKL